MTALRSNDLPAHFAPTPWPPHRRPKPPRPDGLLEAAPMRRLAESRRRSVERSAARKQAFR